MCFDGAKLGILVVLVIGEPDFTVYIVEMEEGAHCRFVPSCLTEFP